jgi:hypothetical protein
MWILTSYSSNFLHENNIKKISIPSHDITFFAMFLPVLTVQETQFPTLLLGPSVSIISYQKKIPNQWSLFPLLNLTSPIILVKEYSYNHLY